MTTRPSAPGPTPALTSATPSVLLPLKATAAHQQAPPATSSMLSSMPDSSMPGPAIHGVATYAVATVANPSSPAQPEAEMLPITGPLDSASLGQSMTGSVPFKAYRISTPQGLWLGLVGLGTTAALFTGVMLSGLRQQQQTVQLLSQNFVPTLSATQRIEESLAALDTNLVQILLAPENLQADAQQAFENHRQKIANDLLQLSQGGTQIGDQASREAQRQTALLQVEFGSYLMAAERAQSSRGNDPEASSLAAYEAALAQLETRLLPAAIALRQAKNEAFIAAYRPSQLRLGRIQAYLFMLSNFQLVSLLLLQLFLSRRTRRTLNPALFLATILTLQFNSSALRDLQQAQQQLQQAQAIATQPLQNLASARSHTYLSHSHLGRSLLDVSTADHSRLQFHNQIFMGLNLNPAAQAHSPLAVSEGKKRSAQAMQQAWTQYQTIAEQVLKLQRTQPELAIALATGYREGQLNAAFEALKEKQTSVMDIYQADLDQATLQSLEVSDALKRKTPVAMATTFALIALGLYFRLREYLR